jgi:hypothetical protein
MTEFVRVRSVDAPGEYMVARHRAEKHRDRYVIVDRTPELVEPVVVPDPEETE